MDQNDEVFLERLRVTFRLEAEEHIKTLSNELLALEKDPKYQQKGIEKLFREAHSLKGASRSVSHHGIQSICQVLEDVLTDWKSGKILMSASGFDTLHATIDHLEHALAGDLDGSKVAAIIEQLKNISQSIEKAPEEKPIENEVQKPIASIDKTVRISLSKLDNLFQEVEELLMVKLTAQQELDQFKKLLGDVAKNEKELIRFISDTQIHRQVNTNDPEFLKKIVTFFERHQKGAKSLHENLGKIVKSSEQNTHFVGTMVDTLLEDMKKILMQPVSTLFETIPRMVRDISRELGKEIELEFNGGEIEVDRRILEELKDPIIHVIRNSIDHGIGTPEERTKIGKSRSGKITIHATETHGSSVIISISDDGKGINTNKLKEVAIQKKMISPKEAEALSPEDTIKLAFQSGVSTSPIITDISGRGIGLGVVTEKVDKLGGRVTVESIPGKGATFKFNLPLTMATFRGVHITVEGEDFIMPAHNILRVIRVKEEEIKTVESLETLTVNDTSLSFVRLADLLGLEKKEKRKSLFALIVKAEEKIIAFGADQIHHEHEVLLKSLGSQCPRVRNIMAATIMDWGKVIPILNPIDLVRTCIKGQILRSRSSDAEQNEEGTRTILLAEDSITTRLMIKNILESAGYEVKTAVDGAEAYEMLQTARVDLLLTDVDMPRMNGFTLTEKVRAMPSYKDLPIIICTARGSKEDRERGIEIGANAYLDKNSFTQQSLMSITEKLL